MRIKKKLSYMDHPTFLRTTKSNFFKLNKPNINISKQNSAIYNMWMVQKRSDSMQTTQTIALFVDNSDCRI